MLVADPVSQEQGSRVLRRGVAVGEQDVGHRGSAAAYDPSDEALAERVGERVEIDHCALTTLATVADCAIGIVTSLTFDRTL
ncbi:hypothetical protein nbrc107696_10270 [Gordonia spumicola]|uniref:Uncharacterized protein n=1 Tax=Gordonia spumicola TaxID=589161 RepID=A0A7I9V695_9ACTN|nr:hypothetical protein nbrc107696_10270 [Gordonia spumicola]